MRVSVDISLYPLDKDFVPPINDVIERLQAHDSIKIFINPMAAQLVGEYDDIMFALKQEIGETFKKIPNAVFTIKILNNPIEG
tara:strand:- start:866 stop:1114 length:249 start_codon:yes stop_codon:yes gene_type:complete